MHLLMKFLISDLSKSSESCQRPIILTTLSCWQLYIYFQIFVVNVFSRFQPTFRKQIYKNICRSFKNSEWLRKWLCPNYIGLKSINGYSRIFVPNGYRWYAIYVWFRGKFSYLIFQGIWYMHVRLLYIVKFFVPFIVSNRIIFMNNCCNTLAFPVT